jgi:DnaJ-class molecular chaperone
VKAVNPFLILDIDEAATREEVDAAHRRLVRLHHPDRHAGASPEAYQAAVARTVEINFAYELLTDPAKAAAHRRTVERVRAAGHTVEPAPQRPRETTPSGGAAAGGDYRAAAAREFTVDGRKRSTPWSAGRRRRWSRRR